MRNKFKYGELVKINGIGKIYGKVKNELGFVIDKDEYYLDYYVDMFFGNKDWFDEQYLEKVLKKEGKEIKNDSEKNFKCND